MVNEMKWISVKDRLPETSGQYLVYTECGDMFNAEFELHYGEFGSWYDCYHSDTLGFLDSEWTAYDDITHWTPLPELPVEGE